MKIGLINGISEDYYYVYTYITYVYTYTEAYKTDSRTGCRDMNTLIFGTGGPFKKKKRSLIIPTLLKLF